MYNTLMSSSSAIPSILLLAACAGGIYYLSKPAPSGIMSTTGIVATNFSTGAGRTAQQIAWSNSDGSYDDSDPNSYGNKLKEVYDQLYGKGRW